MRRWTPQQVADAAGAELVQVGPPTAEGVPGPLLATIDSRQAAPGVLFVGLHGANVNGGVFTAAALAAGAWGVLATPQHAEAAKGTAPGTLLAAEDPLAALQRLATAWRRELGATVIGVTGSTGKTTTKELIAALADTITQVHATPANFNTEIGLPLTVLGAPPETRLLVLEMAMRGPGQIAELARIAEPDAGVVVNVGPAHVELLGSVEAIAAEKASLFAHLPPGAPAVVPAGEALLEAHRRDELDWITFGPGSDLSELPDSLGLGDQPAHVRLDALAALGVLRALGLEPQGPVDLARSKHRGERLPGVNGSTVIDDCYNANPMSMRAALSDLAAATATRRVAVLGDMLELGPDEAALHQELGREAHDSGVELLVTVGARAAQTADAYDELATRHALRFDDATTAALAMPALVDPGDLVLVKASRGVQLEHVVDALSFSAPDATGAR